MEASVCGVRVIVSCGLEARFQSGGVSRAHLQNFRAARRGDVLLQSRGGKHLQDVSHHSLVRSSRAVRSSKRFATARCSQEGLRTVEKVNDESTASDPSFLGSNGSSSTNGSLEKVGVKSDESSAKEGSSYNWLAQWYPVGVLKHMDKRQPYPVTVLGRDLVMWWDRTSGEWQVFSDLCPHRRAPLSEGRINEEGHLECAYHGWAFAASGACTKIPQLEPARAKAKDSPRACAKVYPSMEQQGFLFVYMDASESARERAFANLPRRVLELDDPQFVYDLAMSEVGYSYDTLVENLEDPTHVHFAHHNILGRREKSGPLDLRVYHMDEGGFTGGLGDKGSRNVQKYFAAPTLAVSVFTFPPPPPKGHPWVLKLLEFARGPKKSGAENKIWAAGTVFYVTPMTPSTCRLLYANIRNFAKPAFRWIPRWIAHQKEMLILDSDTYLLNRMEASIEEEGGTANIERIYYTPTGADAYVLGFRKWLKKFGGGRPDYGPLAAEKLPPRESRAALLDRRRLHVDRCTYCSGAKRNFEALVVLLRVLPYLLVGLAAASNTSPLLRNLSNFSIPFVCAAVASVLASHWLSKWIKKSFEYHGWNHALDSH